MAQPGKITQEQVNAICEKLRGLGKRPSARLIRAEHGAGSTGTIQAMLKVWEAQNPAPEHGVSLSPALMKALEDNMQYEVQRARQELAEQLAIAGETISDLTRENEEVADENAALQEAQGTLMDGMAELKGQVHQLENDLATVRAAEQREREAAEQLRIELAKAQLRIEQAAQLQDQHAAVLKELAQERDQRQAAEKQAGIAAAQRDTANERVTEEKARSAGLAALVDKLTKEGTSAAVRVEAAHARLESAAAQLDAAKESAKKERERASEAESAMSEWKGRAEQLIAENAELQERLAKLPTKGDKSKT